MPLVCLEKLSSVEENKSLRPDTNPARQTLSSGSIKIIHVIFRFDFGGLENGLVNIINLTPDCFHHVVVTLTGANDEFVKRLKKPVEIIDVGKKPGQDYAMFWRLWKVFRAQQPDIVHTRNLATIEAQIPAFLAAIPYRVHGEHGWDVSDPLGNVKKYQLLRRFIGVFIHRFIPLSSQIEAYLTDKVGIPVSKISRICNGVDVDRFQQTANANDDLDERRCSPYVFMSVGRLEEIKGHTFLLSALSLLATNHPELTAGLQLVLVGDGSQRASLETQVKTEGIAELVTFTGSRSDISELFKTADCFVLPSLAEGISNTILEAMASGLPVVATDVGGNRDLMVEGETGVLVAPADPVQLAAAMKEYLQNPALGKQQGRAGRNKSVEEFSLLAMVQKYSDVYQRQNNS